MSETLTLTRIPLDDYAGLHGAGEIEELRALAKPLRGRSIEMINATAIGGGEGSQLVGPDGRFTVFTIAGALPVVDITVTRPSAGLTA